MCTEVDIAALVRSERSQPALHGQHIPERGIHPPFQECGAAAEARRGLRQGELSTSLGVRDECTARHGLRTFDAEGANCDAHDKRVERANGRKRAGEPIEPALITVCGGCRWAGWRRRRW